ncbi:hypothetical protein LzC2_38330 [Planctomycetes bacterium LzC2]|uniref:Uncharacterized protein n=1 Tax=Alienimonas chondri TaxID=2681879 RepID=A0ABX1VJT5_9PLAN|nr:hypothetical protein [Alienimonas chondri]
MLVLTDGGVYGGLVTEYSYGVKVRTARGSIVLPSDRVRVNAPSLDDAYFQLKAEIPEKDAAGHAKLAAWCLTNRLTLRSREELLTALELEPDRDDWSRALRRVETVIAAANARAGKPTQAPTHTSSGVVPASHVANASSKAPATASAAGLSAETLRNFTGQVERVLLTRCGNAGCHGGTESGAFQLKNPSRSAATTRLNLAAALAFVGDGNALRSPLVATCVDRADRRGRTPFRVQGGPASKALLTAWVARVAAERPDLAASRTAPVSPAPQTLTESGGAAPPARPIQPDTFDPAEFNRTFASPTADPEAANAAAAAPPSSLLPHADLPE